jgi:hypothetical protein
MESCSWWHDTRRLFYLYLVVGVCFMPSALVYAICAVNGFDRWWILWLALGAGLLLSSFAWNRLERIPIESPKRIEVSVAQEQELIRETLGAVRLTISLAKTIRFVAATPPLLIDSSQASSSVDTISVHRELDVVSSH